MARVQQVPWLLRVILGTLLIAAFSGCRASGPDVEPTTTATGEVPGRCLPAGRDGDVAGGEIQDGPFTFDLALYVDRSLKSPEEADHPSRASDIPGIGWRATWVYHGSPIRALDEAYGPMPHPLPVSSYHTVTDGQEGGRQGGGVVLPPDVKLGDEVGLGIRVDTADATFGAVLVFTFTGQEGQLQACEIFVSPWPGPFEPERSASR